MCTTRLPRLDASWEYPDGFILTGNFVFQKWTKLKNFSLSFNNLFFISVHIFIFRFNERNYKWPPHVRKTKYIYVLFNNISENFIPICLWFFEKNRKLSKWGFFEVTVMEWSKRINCKLVIVKALSISFFLKIYVYH